MNTPVHGSCLCGGVTFLLASEPATVIECFCKHCSKGAGGPSQLIAKQDCTNVTMLTGSELVAQYVLNDTASGAPQKKAFCSRCGTPLWTVPNSAKGKFLMIRVSLLSNWERLQRSSEIFIKYRPEWIAQVENASQWQEARH